MKLLWILIFILTILITGYSQNDTIRILSGQFLESSQPLIGATINLEDHPYQGTITNMNGEFKLEVPRGKDFKIPNWNVCMF